MFFRCFEELTHLESSRTFLKTHLPEKRIREKGFLKLDCANSLSASVSFGRVMYKCIGAVFSKRKLFTLDCSLSDIFVLSHSFGNSHKLLNTWPV